MFVDEHTLGTMAWKRKLWLTGYFSLCAVYFILKNTHCCQNNYLSRTAFTDYKNGKFMKGLPVSSHTTCRSLDFCGVQISLLKDRWKINLWIVFGLMFIMVDSLYCCLLPCVMILLFLDCSTGYDIRTFERYAGLNTQVRIIVTNIWLSLHLVYHHQLNITITRYRICGPLKYCLISGLGFSSILNIHNDITNIPLQHGKSRHFVVV